MTVGDLKIFIEELPDDVIVKIWATCDAEWDDVEQSAKDVNGTLVCNHKDTDVVLILTQY